MSAVAATFFDGRSSRAHAVRVDLESGALTICAADWARTELLSGVRVTPRVAGIHRTLLLRDGGQLQVEDNDAVDAWFPGRHRGAAFIDRLERHSVAVAAALLVSVLGVAGTIFYGIPYAARKVADFIPPSVARSMGEQTVTLLDRFGFDDSALPPERRDALRARFTRYVADLPDPGRYQLRFKKAKMANAFALPGGIIVVTDEMVRVIGAIDGKTGVASSGGSGGDGCVCRKKDYEKTDVKSADGGVIAMRGRNPERADATGAGKDEPKAHFRNTDGSDAGTHLPGVNAGDSDDTDAENDNAAGDNDAWKTAADERFLAVVAHEIGHEEHKHVLRSVLQSSGVVLVGAYFTGDVSSASALVVAVPTFLLDSHYSRAFETEADQYAFASLAAHGISPGRFAEVMTMMMQRDPRFRHGDREGGYLSTHPATAERILAARKAAERFEAQ